MITSENSITHSETTKKPTSDNSNTEDLDDNNSNTETDFEMKAMPNKNTEMNFHNLIRRRDITRGCFTRQKDLYQQSKMRIQFDTKEGDENIDAKNLISSDDSQNSELDNLDIEKSGSDNIIVN
ncbi:hypothetical protein M0813_13603 [Anaeramoeba flamelloides]|uniref:Uncharacterized protein n=1 Tax=Anaeramoeba flamelloides TaxID=1746091 RepID=A0AAV7ZAS3_9EUKA|nr:hypothetical protein M0812_15159 [Anaeramoeba flamelloides]KAJ6253106.1 hypothetical protein M0813_13603 [Anaeramoeba flamelloides]